MMSDWNNNFGNGFGSGSFGNNSFGSTGNSSFGNSSFGSTGNSSFGSTGNSSFGGFPDYSGSGAGTRIPSSFGAPPRKKKKKRWLWLLLLIPLLIAAANVFLSMIRSDDTAARETPAAQTTAAPQPTDAPQSTDTPQAGAAAPESTIEPEPTATPQPAAQTSADLYWYRTQLTDAEQTVYDQLVNALDAGQLTITPAADITADETTIITRAVYYDHPEFFWVGEGSEYTYDGSGRVTELTATANDLYSGLAANRAQFEAAVQTVLDEIGDTSGMADWQLERAAHDALEAWILDYADNEYDQTAWSAFITRETVCAGYSSAFVLIMQRLGVPCIHVSGSSLDDETGRWGAHAWNLVYLQGDWYNIDLTWDDVTAEDLANFDLDPDWNLDPSRAVCSYEYYNLPDSAFTDHIAETDYAVMPACTSAACGYAALYGETPAAAFLRQIDPDGWYTVDSCAEFWSLAETALEANGTGTIELDFLFTDESEWEDLCADFAARYEQDLIYPAADAMGLGNSYYRYGYSSMNWDSYGALYFGAIITIDTQ